MDGAEGWTAEGYGKRKKWNLFQLCEAVLDYNYILISMVTGVSNAQFVHWRVPGVQTAPSFSRTSSLAASFHVSCARR